MSNRKRFARRGTVRLLAAAILLGALLLSAGAALAQGGIPAVDWWVLGSGGGAQTAGGEQSAGGTVLDGTLGQPFVGEASAGNIAVSSGYWTEISSPSSGGGQPLFLPFLQR